MSAEYSSCSAFSRPITPHRDLRWRHLAHRVCPLLAQSLFHFGPRSRCPPPRQPVAAIRARSDGILLPSAPWTSTPLLFLARASVRPWHPVHLQANRRLPAAVHRNAGRSSTPPEPYHDAGRAPDLTGYRALQRQSIGLPLIGGRCQRVDFAMPERLRLPALSLRFEAATKRSIKPASGQVAAYPESVRAG